jgi:hypothetical protein
LEVTDESLCFLLLSCHGLWSGDRSGLRDRLSLGLRCLGGFKLAELTAEDLGRELTELGGPVLGDSLGGDQGHDTVLDVAGAAELLCGAFNGGGQWVISFSWVWSYLSSMRFLDENMEIWERSIWIQRVDGSL